VKLLCGYYAPQKGRVTISGININDINKVDYWSKLSVLFQESDAFGITVREIIAAGNISKIADQKSVIEHAKLAQIDEWIQSLPLKYDNPIGRDFEKGVSPSSGQWQRLAIARTLFKNPEIMVLDEPTSNVDPQAEENIFNQILATGLDKIILFISHRFSTVRRANKILVLENGKISEQGTHDQLLNADGTYARLFRLQAKNYQ
jgi:ATP-binding cassette subfamily B protein